MTMPSCGTEHDSVGCVLSAASCERLCDALARAASFQAAMPHIDAAREAALGHGLLTVNLNATMANDPPDEVQLQRLWSSDPGAYPVAGRKRKTSTAWTQQLLWRAELFIGEGDAALAEVFDDHARISALGLHAVVNIPILEDGRCVATFNVLSTRPRWRTHEIALVRLLALLATPWVLLARREEFRREA
jgi:GAF domain-containing protein